MKYPIFKPTLVEFSNFKIDGIVHLKGGLTGKVTGSRIYQGETYVDVDWENGATSCDYHLPGAGDGASDNFLGGTVNGN